MQQHEETLQLFLCIESFAASHILYVFAVDYGLISNL